MAKRMNKSLTFLLIAVMLVASLVAPLSTVFATADEGKVVTVFVSNEVGKAFQEGVKYSNNKIKGVNTGEQGYDDSSSIVVTREKVGRNETQAESTVTIMSVTDTSVKFHSTGISVAKPKEVSEAIGAVMEYITDEGVITNEQLSDFNSQLQAAQDPQVQKVILPIIMGRIGGDVWVGFKWLQPFIGIFNSLLGAGVIIILALLIASTVMDLAYIGLPMWREEQNNRSEKSGRRLFLVTNEAKSTVMEVEKDLDGSYKNGYVIYFKKRAVSYFVLALCILYLVLGGLSGIITTLISFTTGFVN